MAARAVRLEEELALGELHPGGIARGEVAGELFELGLALLQVHEAALRGPERGLDAVHDALHPGGRLAVISFHSLEDRIVKQFVARHAKAPPANRRLPVAQAFVPALADVGGGAIRADEAELAANPRSRSAVLRVAEKLDGQGRKAA